MTSCSCYCSGIRLRDHAPVSHFQCLVIESGLLWWTSPLHTGTCLSAVCPNLPGICWSMLSAYRETFILIFLTSSLVQLSNLDGATVENNWIIHVMHVDCRDHRPAVRIVRCYRNVALLVYARACLFIVSPAVLTFTRTSQSVGPKLVEVHQDTVWILNLIKFKWSCAVCKSEACIPCFLQVTD